jgi:N-acetylglucosaminyldiphosphoundecaprenol N-acetyl-beta-D-mannosaminyltransferase
MATEAFESRQILNVRVDATTYENAADRIMRWAAHNRSCYVCLANVNSLMEARASREYQAALHSADLVTADGMPLVWLLRWLGAADAARVYGPDLMAVILGSAEREGIAVGFYGGSESSLPKLVAAVTKRFSDLKLRYTFAPPFRPLTPEEDENVVRAINDSAVRILFVGTGGAKQDYWMHAHHGRIHAVMLGVGAAFDFLARTKPQAPRWMQQSGLEWLFRLVVEPRRLWRRYLVRNPHFAILALAFLVRTRFHEHRRPA